MSDRRYAEELKQHHIDVIAAALDALGQDWNAVLTTAFPFCLNAAGLAIKMGGASPQFQIANRVRYEIGGLLYFIGPIAALSFSPGMPSVPIASACTYLVQVDTNSNISTVSETPLSGGNPNVPNASKGLAAIGLICVVTNGSTTFAPGVDNLDKPGLTVDYVDYVGFGSQPASYPRLPTAPFTSAAVLDTGAITPTPFNPDKF